MSYFGPSVVLADVLSGSRPFMVDTKGSDPEVH